MSGEMENPLVSVIVPSYNGEGYIAETLKSIDEQTYNPLEIIVVDDCSTDGTISEIKSIDIGRSINLIRHSQNEGIASTRNTGVEAATGEYLSILDQDDLWKPQKLEKQINIMESDSDIGICFTNITHVDEDGLVLWKQNFNMDLYSMSGYEVAKLVFNGYPNSGIPQTSELIRSKVFEDCGYYNDDLFGMNDTEFLLRVVQHYSAYVIKENLTVKRQHEQNASRDRQKIINDAKYLTEVATQIYPELEKYRRKRYNFFSVYEAGNHMLNGNINEGVRKFYSNIRNNPFNTIRHTFRLMYELILDFKRFN